MVDRPRGEDEPLGDLAVAQPVGEQLEDLEFTGRERRWIGGGAAPRTHAGCHESRALAGGA